LTSSRPSRALASPAGVRVERAPGEQVLVGVCAGIGAAFGIDTALVRIAFLIAIFAGGLGVVAYVIAAAGMPAAAGAVPPPRVQRIPMAVGAVAVASGFLSLADVTGLVLPDALIWAVVVVGAGAALIWRSVGGEVRVGEAWGSLFGGVRAIGGVLLVSVGAALALRQFGGIGPAVAAALAAGTVAAGIGLLVTPSIRRARAEADAERRERITSEERERVASRLHDSVLQTLALIQREPDGERARVLARRQDRELRAWLYGGDDPAAATTLGSALREAVSAVEESYGVTVDLVQPGDVPMEPRLEALVDATREAMTNAAKHAGVSEISVLVRVADDRATVFVRDRGVGFDPAAVPPDRAGLRDSITGRLARAGGRVEIDTRPGEGTDIEMSVPRDSVP
jgi:signal transduction histidine kinase